MRTASVRSTSGLPRSILAWFLTVPTFPGQGCFPGTALRQTFAGIWSAVPTARQLNTVQEPRPAASRHQRPASRHRGSPSVSPATLEDEGVGHVSSSHRHPGCRAGGPQRRHRRRRGLTPHIGDHAELGRDRGGTARRRVRSGGGRGASRGTPPRSRGRPGAQRGERAGGRVAGRAGVEHHRQRLGTGDRRGPRGQLGLPGHHALRRPQGVPAVPGPRDHRSELERRRRHLGPGPVHLLVQERQSAERPAAGRLDERHRLRGLAERLQPRGRVLQVARPRGDVEHAAERARARACPSATSPSWRSRPAARTSTSPGTRATPT